MNYFYLKIFYYILSILYFYFWLEIFVIIITTIENEVHSFSMTLVDTISKNIS